MSTTMNRFLGSGSKAGGAGSSADTRKEWSKNSDLVRSQIAQKMLTEEEHLVVEREILEDYVSQSCFSFSTLKFFKAKMTSLCKEYWKLHGREYQLSFETTEERQDAKRDKMEGIAFLDIVLRLFISTLLVRYVAYTPTEAFFNFLVYLRDMGAINWSTMYCLSFVEYTIPPPAPKGKEKAKPKKAKPGKGHTYLKRWIDLYATARAQQWKLFMHMLYRPSFAETMNALENIIPGFRSVGKAKSFFPQRTSVFVQEPHIFGILLEQNGQNLLRMQSDSEGRQMADYNFLTEACDSYRGTLQQVGAAIRYYYEHDGTVRIEGAKSLDELITQEGKSDIPAIGYLAMYSFKDDAGVQKLANRPILKRKSTDGKFVNVPFPSIEEFNKAGYELVAAMLRY